jgi:hypothetical protein
MPKLFSYVLEHDYGFAPNPSDGYCTLAWCKYGGKRKNIVELADEKKGDWVVGTGGKDIKKSAGHGKLIYAMRVDEKMTLVYYFRDPRFKGRADNLIEGSKRKDRFVLISKNYFYFGRNAIDIQKIPKKHLAHSFEKRGPNYRSDFSDEFINDFATWLASNHKVGVHGPSCGSAA